MQQFNHGRICIFWDVYKPTHRPMTHFPENSYLDILHKMAAILDFNMAAFCVLKFPILKTSR